MTVQKALVTGGLGFVGSNLVDRLIGSKAVLILPGEHLMRSCCCITERLTY